ncbi:DNA mismatch repair protein MutS [Erythrobacter arachoides]|uniref:DNA mismatch repair protein MutS n=1 Tax=Aurantiacibacter arachoides TaxID=1850444 RepID=A0A844ZZR7_9SPHN|nr:Smr/MutS family protein [Aurantiacibacter arachoides]MXO92227.1 DNA mismatch repair protein MutS [Aurantiacibacter arachoides]GGD58685.1 DNA mismatch repair protein MutS [Aurantiacibacter arachoides]
MNGHPRGLSAEEAAAWDRLARTVKPLVPVRPKPQTGNSDAASSRVKPPPPPPAKVRKPAAARPQKPAPPPKPAAAPPSPGLDSHWERRLARTGTDPDFTLDLHGHTLDQAYRRLDDGLIQAKAMGARLVLVVTGKSRPVDAADRGQKRGAIRAKILDWLAAGSHASDIAAVRQAHRRHGGEGALYLVLKKRR